MICPIDLREQVILELEEDHNIDVSDIPKKELHDLIELVESNMIDQISSTIFESQIVKDYS